MPSQPNKRRRHPSSNRSAEATKHGRPDRRKSQGSSYRSFALIHEDSHILAVSKPDGLLVTMAESNEQTLQDQVRKHTRKSPEPDAQLPSAVHRLDRYTSGIVLFGRTKRGLDGLSRLIRENEMQKQYYLLTVGDLPENNGRIDIPLKAIEAGKKRMIAAKSNDIGAQESITDFEVEERLRDPSGQAYTLVRATLLTGRTHQLRVHFSEIGYPIAGDSIYGVKGPNRFLRERAKLLRQFLHARQLEFDHPVTGQHLQLQAKLPKDLVKILHFLRGK